MRQRLYSSQIDTVYHGYSFYMNISWQNRMFAEFYNGVSMQFGTSPISSSLNFLSLVDAGANNFVGLSGTSWSGSEDEIYFSCINGFDNSGLYRMSASSGSYEKLVDYCDNRHYMVISCSSDDNSLIVEKVLSTLIMIDDKPTGEIRRKSKIYLLDLETFEETEIHLD